jgi:hypothetical protein
MQSSSGPRALGLLIASTGLIGCYDAYEVPDAGPRADGGWAEYSITDTLGWTVAGRYALTPPVTDRALDSGTPFPVECREGIAHASLDLSGRVLMARPQCGGSGVTVYNRPVVCETTDPCEDARRYWASRFPDETPFRTECREGLCQFPDQPLTQWDVVALCLHDLPRWPDPDTVSSDEAGYPAIWDLILATTCAPGECTVPSSCRQP